jgi:hypothetical protein
LAKRMLFYEEAVPINTDRHMDWSVEPGEDFAFARITNAVPLTCVEFSRAWRDYPIVFAEAGAETAPMALLGIEERQNIFISPHGRWDASYIPAFVRRYPFVFATADGGDNFTVCIDERFAGWNQEGRGQKLFGPEGEESDYLKTAVKFLSEYQRQYQITRAFASKLEALELLEPMEAKVERAGGRNISLTGFKVIKREALKSLDAEILHELIQSDYLEMVYLHIHSLDRFQDLVQRASGRSATG